MCDFVVELNKKSKNEIVDILLEMIENKDLQEEILGKYIKTEELSTYQQTIVDKLKNEIPLTEEEIIYTKNCLSKRNNAKINTILAGNKKFDAYLVDYKLQKYFENAWKIYPLKVGKELGKKAFYKLLGVEKYSELTNKGNYITQRIKAYNDYCDENDKDKQYILHFSTFCNTKKYL